MPGPLENQAADELARAMRFRMARAAALAANVANADTPGYRPVDLHFDAALDDAAARLARTNGRHLAAGPGGSEYRVEVGPRGSRPDGNGVELEREVVKVSRNAGAFTDQAAVLTRLLQLKRTAIGEGR